MCDLRLSEWMRGSKAVGRAVAGLAHFACKAPAVSPCRESTGHHYLGYFFCMNWCVVLFLFRLNNIYFDLKLNKYAYTAKV